MQINAKKQMASSYFLHFHKKYLEQIQIMQLDTGAWAECLAKIKPAEKYRNTTGLWRL